MTIQRGLSIIEAEPLDLRYQEEPGNEWNGCISVLQIYFVGEKHSGSRFLILINKLPAGMLRPSTH